MLNSKRLISFLLLLLLELFSTSVSRAGFEEYSPQAAVDEVSSAGSFGPIQVSYNRQSLLNRLEELRSFLSVNTDFRHRNDYASTLLKLGRLAEGRELLQTLRTQFPKEARIASNLATAYEMEGNLTAAETELQAAMALDKSVQGGMGWLHLLFLKSSKQATNADWYENHSVLGLDIEKEMLAGKSLGKVKSAKQTIKNIENFIKLRLPHSALPDPAIANALGDLAVLYARYYSPVEAYKVLSVAVYTRGDNSQRLGEISKQISAIKNGWVGNKEPTWKQLQELPPAALIDDGKGSEASWDSLVYLLLEISRRELDFEKKPGGFNEPEEEAAPEEVKTNAVQSPSDSLLLIILFLLPMGIVAYLVYLEVD